jgi:putative transposase
MPKNKHEIMIDRKEWPAVNPELLDDKNKEIFLKRKKAIDAYIDTSATIEEITADTGMLKPEIYRLLNRCQKLDRNGIILGYRALIPYYRTDEYTLKTTQNINGFENEESKKTGAFQALLNNYPAIADEIERLVFKKDKNDKVKENSRIKDIYKKFIRFCKSQGLTPEKGSYPFNTRDLGRRSFYRHVKNLRLSNPQLIMKNFGEDAEMLYNSTGVGDKNNIIERPFERVELDGHRLDISLAVRFTTPEGDEIVNTIDRIWLLAIVDVATNLTLGYHVVINKEYSADDVMMCVRNACLPWVPKKLTIPALKMPKEGGFASEIIPVTKYAIWDEICFDNAMAHLANKVKKKLKQIIGCAVNTGPVGTPTRRPKIEKLFHILEDEAFHRLVNTTGSNPKDPRRKDPEKKAVTYEISVEEIEQLVEVYIANQNGKPQRSLNNLSPLEVMQQRINRNYAFRTLDEEYRDGREFMVIYDTRTLRGSIGKGRRPSIRYEGVDYRNDLLAESFSLVGTKLTLEIDTDDLRYLRAYLPDGGELGILKAQGKWAIRKHSLKIRKSINSLNYRGLLHFLNEDDPIEIYHNYLKTKAKENRNSRTKLVQFEHGCKEETISKVESDEINSLELPNDCNSKDLYPNKKISLDIDYHHNEPKPKNTRERYFFNS